MTSIETIILAIVAAATVEAVWETLKMIWEEGRIQLNRVGPILIGLLIAFTLPVDVFAILGFPFTTPIVGRVLTGILLSRGSNWMHDWIEGLRRFGEGR